MTNPTWSLREIFGDGVGYVPVPCFDQPGWMFADRLLCDVLTGNQLVLAGSVPVICHRDAATPRILRLLEHAGHRRPEAVSTYTTQPEYSARLAEFTDAGLRIVVNHAQATPLDALWIPGELLRALNDKGELERLVPPDALPRRHRVAADEFAALDSVDLPVVAKVSSLQTSGAGYGVCVCDTLPQFRAAQQHLASAPAVVLEEKLEITNNWCVQFIVAPDGQAHFIGAAEQVAGADGSWHGNWIAEPAPDEVVRVCAAVVDAGSAQGYRGVVGIDTVRSADGRTLVLDANFRFNGSTAALLLRDAIGAAFIRSRGWGFDGPFEELDQIVRELTAAGQFLPNSAWDPPTGACRVTGLVSGETRQEVEALLARMKLAGLR